MKPAFIINNRNKGAHVYKAVKGALSQTYPCEIIISDQASTDNSLSEIEIAIKECQRGAEHEIRVLHCPVDGPSCMETGNKHVQWCVQQTKAEFIYQCSADDFSLPNRVALCEEARKNNPCDAIATTMFFAKPEQLDTVQPIDGIPVSGYPRESGYVHAGEGLRALAYGSVIAGYSREFLERVGHGGKNTIDVLFGFLAAMGKGFYVVAEPAHVHVQHAGSENMGYGGKLLAASGDELERLKELNHFQLFRLYKACYDYAIALYGEIPQEHIIPLLNMMVGQGMGWCDAREALHIQKIQPGMEIA